MNQSTEPAVHIHCHVLGPFETNCYIVEVEGSRDCWVVDAGFEPDPMLQVLKDRKLQPVKLILTHAHVDHIAGINRVRKEYPDLPILIHQAEADFLSDPQLNLSAAMGIPVTAPAADGYLQEDDEPELAGSRWRVLHTPGHSPGGIVLYHAASGNALVGDTLFYGSIGRFDFPTSDEQQLYRSIREKLYSLPGDTVVHPGHGPSTTIERERSGNPFVRL